MRNCGGTNRVIYSPCGWVCKGSIRDANGKLRIHMRVCIKCQPFRVSIPEYDTSDIKSFSSMYTRKGYKSETYVTISNPNGNVYVKVGGSGQEINNLLYTSK